MKKIQRVKRKISILPNLSQIYESCLYTQMNKYFDPILSKYQFRFRKGYSAWQCLLTMSEKWRASLDHNGTCEALLTDLSKAFDCLPHDLLIAKLHACSCDLPSLKLRNSYLDNRHQRVKINNFYSTWARNFIWSPKRIYSRSHIFNIFLCDLFLFIKNKDVNQLC